MQEIEALTAERETAQATTPSEWDAARSDFTELQLAERKQRTEFRRAADKGYQPIVELQKTLAAVPALKALSGEFDSLRELITNSGGDATIDELAAASKRFGDVEGASKIKSEISKARKALRAKKPDREKAVEAILAAEEEYQSEVQWREQAQAEIGSQVAEYEATIRSSIGVRQQTRLTKDQALYVAACDAGHRDISLNF